ncbi:TPA: DEAD/DEAH box helicase family protein [Vibrio cholerae]
MSDRQSFLYSGHKLSSGGANDPLLPRLVQAINHATEIEISVSFIQPSGLDLLFDPLFDAVQSGAQVKLLTSDYLSITHPVALRRLMLLTERGAQCRVFECGQHSFHMKSYIFVRCERGEILEGCAWIGSNNISKTALLDSHEWALRHDFEPPETSAAALEFLHIRQQFAAIFTHNQSQPLSHQWIDNYLCRYQQTQQQRTIAQLVTEDEQETIDVPTPNSIQIEALAALDATRQQGYSRGLVVLATGMGKTWLSAFDVMQMQAKNVLFVAHREEILLQAEKTFSQLIPHAKTGLYNGSIQDDQATLLFASVATLGKQNHLQCFAVDHFDYLIVDEFHHAAARSYRQLLAYFQPKFLLGLTATPERSDQADILSLCDDNLVFERNLVHGIDDEILTPFDYHGIYDQAVNYQEIPWRNGKFDPNTLDNKLATSRRAEHVYREWQAKKQTRTLAFCVSKKHADFMAQYFVAKGIHAIAVYSDSAVRRNQALQWLDQGKIEIIFSVDLFNEGTDLPSIDTILMARPTESKILFLQQLGRGLRLSPITNKRKLVVLDFIGNHDSFLNRPATLFNVKTLREVIGKLQTNAPLAKGCHVNFDIELINFWQRLAKRLRNNVQDDYQQLAHQLAHRPTASEFFHHGYPMKKVRQQAISWFHLVASQENDPHLSELVSHYGDFLLHGIENTAMSKSFKAILLEALLELDGLRQPPTLSALAERSHHVLSRRPQLMAQELTESAKQFQASDQGWLKYWLANPINAFTKPNNKSAPWFTINDQKFVATFAIKDQHIELLHDAMQELVDLRLAEYAQRPQQQQPSNQPDIEHSPSAQVLEFAKQSDPQGTMLPFYPELKIACGHFKRGSHEAVQYHCVADGYGKLDPTRHFVAPAAGNSMNGGKNPIQDGDLLLLEWVTPSSAGSISNLTMAIETQDETGDNQYLLRVVRKIAPNQYELQAQNPSYPNMPATDAMKTFARLKAVIKNNSQQSQTR